MPLILLAHHNKDYRRRLARGLEMAGFSVLQAQDGGQAASLVMEKEPDALVIDLVMPVRDGIDVIVEVKRSGIRTKIVAISSWDLNKTEDYLMLLRTVGVDEALAKPFQVEELV